MRNDTAGEVGMGQMKTQTIGVLTPILDGFYFNGILQGIQQAAEELGLYLVVFQTMDAALTRITHTRMLGEDVVDGWIVLLDAVRDPRHIETLEASGKPVICTPHAGSFTRCSTFCIDNEQAEYDAVVHLIGHGHSRIACVYSSENEESLLRYAGYRRALEEHGLSCEESLVYDVDNLLEHGGVLAAQQMKERGFDFTAMAVSSDLAALKLVEMLISWGIRVPEDIAVIGFDNVDTSRSSGLSSVSQPLLRRGREMTELLHRQLSAGAWEPVQQTEQTALVLRNSCGCRVEDNVEEVRDLQRSSLETIDYLSRIIRRNHRVSRELMRVDAGRFRDLTWLANTGFSWGCLAFWAKDGGLVTESIYSLKEMAAPVEPGEAYDERSFPPPSLLSTVAAGEMLSVHPVVSLEREWGCMLLIGPRDTRSQMDNYQYDSISYILEMLSYALEREAMYEEARERERLLEIVSTTTNDGIFDWNLETNQIEWNGPMMRIMNLTELQMSGEELYERMHPEDRAMVRKTIADFFTGGGPFKVEFRLQKSTGIYIWVAAAGEVLKDSEERPLRMIGSLQDISERRAAEEQIRHIAYHDALTLLPNRRYIFDLISTVMERNSGPFALMLLDLDRFKTVNDTLGHSAGDSLLQRVARVLREQVRPCDTVARLGGDEFIVLCPGWEPGERAAVDQAEHILEALRQLYQLEGHPIYVSASIGIGFYPEHGKDRETLVKHADIAMYQAKELGKNRIQIYHEQLSTESISRARMENSLRQAIVSGEFELYYQPQINLQQYRVHGMEALIRWNSPEFGRVPPLSFIPLAEETGLIHSIGEWVLWQACTDTKRLIRERGESLVVSVNISAHQFMDRAFVRKVKVILEDTGLAPELLCLEITESVAIENMELTLQHLGELMETGIRVALDDFGTGYSSLSIVKALPLHMIKIDRSFVQDPSQSAVNKAIFTTILGSTRGLMLESCAEGVESWDQYRMVQEQGCSLVQGYLICRPVPLEEFKSFLEAWEKDRPTESKD